MQNENYAITSQYLKDLKTLLDNKSEEVTKYDIAHASFRKNNSHWIIKSKDTVKLTITYLNGDVITLPTYNELMKRVKWANDDYKPARRKFIARYYKIINAFHKHRARLKKKTNSIANALTPEQVRKLVQKY